MKEGKPFFFRVDAAAIIDFATDPEGEGMTLLRFGKELQKGKSEIPFIQGIIDEAIEYIDKKKQAGSAGGKAKASNAIAMLQHTPSIPLASSSSSSSSSNRSSTEAEALESKEDSSKQKVSRPPHKKKLSDEEMMQEIKSSPAYQGIDIDREFSKLQIWCTKKGKVPTIARFINWLNNADQPLLNNGTVEKPKSFRERVNDAAVEGFLARRGIND